MKWKAATNSPLIQQSPWTGKGKLDKISRRTKTYYFIEWWNSENIAVEVEMNAFYLEWSIDLIEIGDEDRLRHKYLLNSEEFIQSVRSGEES